MEAIKKVLRSIPTLGKKKNNTNKNNTSVNKKNNSKINTTGYHEITEDVQRYINNKNRDIFNKVLNKIDTFIIKNNTIKLIGKFKDFENEKRQVAMSGEGTVTNTATYAIFDKDENKIHIEDTYKVNSCPKLYITNNDFSKYQKLLSGNNSNISNSNISNLKIVTLKINNKKNSYHIPLPTAKNSNKFILVKPNIFYERYNDFIKRGAKKEKLQEMISNGTFMYL
jgi:hypothetical protein